MAIIGRQSGWWLYRRWCQYQTRCQICGRRTGANAVFAFNEDAEEDDEVDGMLLCSACAEDDMGFDQQGDERDGPAE